MGAGDEDLKEAHRRLQAYHDKTNCLICRDEIEPYIRGVEAIAENNELTEAILKKENPGPALAADAERLRDESRQEARRLGVLPSERPTAGPRPKRGLLAIRPRDALRETAANFRESVRLVPRPREILRGEEERR